ncbi:MAG: cytosine permease [Gammaproteobacteria bacterium]|nr:cytosine permease [Gammaproteobacteria bacterium]MBV8402766.1 cytosine permease [Gammaproteobacteria bacterium]
MPSTYKSSRIEQHTIYQIPLDQRHGKAGQLFTLWFGANLNVLTVVTGALATTIFHQSFLSAVLAILLGNLVGTIFMALHAAQGPRLGVPQMVQSRGQFGARGAGFVVALVAFMYVGYAGTAFVTGGQSLHFIVPSLSEDAAILAIGAISLAGAVYGHDLIHFSTRMMTYVSGSALLLCYVWLLFVTPIPASYLTQGSFSAVGFFKMVSMGALWQLGYAPYVSDYSRYLPPDSGPRAAFWACYWGTTLGAVVPMILGAMIGPAVVDGNVVTAIGQLTGQHVAFIVMLLLAPGVAVAGAICLYGGSLAMVTLGHTLVPGWHATHRARIAIAATIFVIALLISIAGATNFLPLYSHFNELLLYLMVPWTAVNLIDYYLIRFGDYHVPSFFAADGGIYGHYNLTALACYLVGVIVQIPFIATDFYTGPLAHALGDVDISWLVGIAVVSPVYYFAVRSFQRPAARAPAARQAR